MNMTQKDWLNAVKGYALDTLDAPKESNAKGILNSIALACDGTAIGLFRIGLLCGVLQSLGYDHVSQRIRDCVNHIGSL